MRALFSPSASTSIRISTLPTTLHKTLFTKSRLSLSLLESDIVPFLPFSPLISNNIPKSNSFTTISSSSSSSSTTTSTISTEAEVAEHHETAEKGEEKFDWYAQWYPVMPVCDLDKMVPHAKKVIGLDIVVWWDRNEGTWKVFDDACPHRLAPLSEGRIDQWGRLQCVYHGWCFNGSGDCKFIPQAPPDGRQIHTFKKACATVYPSTVYHDIVWFWPNSDPQHKDIIMKKQPPTIPELDDPSVLFKLTGNRDFPYGYEVLIENLMDPAHLPYAHYGIASTREPKGGISSIVIRDGNGIRIQWLTTRTDPNGEGGCPLEFSVKKPMSVDGFIAKEDKFGTIKFIAPFISVLSVKVDQGDESASSVRTENKPPLKKTDVLIFICIPVSPGNSRLIWVYPKTSEEWTAKLFPRWFFHMIVNIVLDSDLYLLHVEERRIMDVSNTNWQMTCFVPTKSDTLVVGFRRWLNKYGGGQIDWRGKYTGVLPTTSPPKDQLLDRYWSHVVNCRSCSAAYKGLNALEVILQVASVAFVGIVAATATKQNVTSAAARNTMAAMAVVCFAGSRWLAHFIYKNFHFHDYNHAHV